VERLIGVARVAGVFVARLLLVVLIASVLSPMADARVKAKSSTQSKRPDYTSIVIDAETGKVVSEQNADAPNYPASLTKMMTLYLLFEALDKGRIKLDTPLAVSAYAAGQEPTKLGLQAGETVSVQDAILGLVTRSANDAAVTVAEGLAGSEDAFAQRMTAKAHALGMTNTTFRNASGLPDPGQMTTARDLSKLARALYHDFPEDYRFFATEKFVFRGRVVTTHNHLMQHFAGMDGIKTGYIRAAGFNLAASAVRDGHRLIGVVMGGRSAPSRDLIMASLLNTAFADTRNTIPTRNSDPIATLVQANNDVPAPAPATAVSAPALTPVAVADASETSVADEPVAAAAEPQTFAARAKRTLRSLSPVGSAEAAQPPRTARVEAETDRWSIQVGAFSQKSAAEKAAANALATLHAGKGKSIAVVAPSSSEKERYYRARIVNFGEREAEHACQILRKKHRDCAVLAPSSVHVAQAN
jgi:D-alanyl-D-alanine carboxypeptidase